MEDRKDVFSLIVSASETDGKLTMSDEELVGNTFFLLFAGHETMAHIWNATIGFLALYEDAQEEAYREVVAVAPGDTPITFSMSTKLEKVLACFLETGRLFPPGFVLMRDTTDDVVLTTYDEHRVESKIALSRGVRVAVDMVGLHYNPRHFPEPEEYRPSRWYDVPESEHSFYSIGPRACTGRKFANTEACCFLAHLLREWRLKIVLRPGESRQQWRARVLRAKATMTLGVGDVPVQLVRR
ncbi:cytochrome P450 [Leucogyrophana mollusca]|uniref:Cytochrome P450 n=1 Tax=Leucogyrophana mollusca TaxID=85980 RepID=A0ACB8AUJ5_9AGAM|nr:cytochrome P450 [Leucogyrophana mollusca]